MPLGANCPSSHGEMSGLRGDFSALQRHVILILAAQAVGLIGLMGALVAAQL
jgi:hypothetical protein